MREENRCLKNIQNGCTPFRDVKMSRDICGPCASSAFTVWEVVVVAIVIFVSLSIVFPHVSGVREAARRMSCMNQLKQMGLALHNYANANQMFPPGTICASDPMPPSNQYDVWSEAGRKEPGYHGTSFLLQILPFMEHQAILEAWDFSRGVGATSLPKDSKNSDQYSNRQLAGMDIKGLYCPSRRHDLRPGEHVMMLDPSWTGGGTDYGGCAGRHAAFTNQTGYNLCDATMYYEPDFRPKDKEGHVVEETPEKRWGIFGRVNIGTTFANITDGCGQTIMTGELQRLTDITPGSKDGWAIGGPATLFTTGALVIVDGQTTRNVVPPESGTPLSNKFWGSPGSDHPGMANFGMADGSVHAISVRIDPSVFALLGSMADACSVEFED